MKTTEQIKEAIEAEALKQSELNSETESFSTGLYTGWKYGCNWLLSQLSAWGYVKVTETDEELKIKCTQSIEALFDSDNYDIVDCSNNLTTIAQAYAAKEAVGFVQWFMGSFHSILYGELNGLTTEELYQQYKQQSNGTEHT